MSDRLWWAVFVGQLIVSLYLAGRFGWWAGRRAARRRAMREWEKYTTYYAPISKEELLEKMRQAALKTKLQPPEQL